MQELAGLFAVEIYSYVVMSNHLHVVVRTRPGQVATWDDAEVARRANHEHECIGRFWNGRLCL